MQGDLEEFQLVRPLGRGGMGEVYLGHDTVLDRAVAIKLIGSTTPDAASRDRFLTEARAIARLSHPNVVTIFRVGTTNDGRPFLVQELIRGRSLDQVPRPLAWRQVSELAIGIARGLDAAHRRGILHRDVKPANVMLDDRGEARLLDFGLAKLTSATEREIVRPPSRATVVDGDVAATRDHAQPREVATATTARGDGAASEHDGVLGTPRYMAPEVWRGEPATVKSDLYSLGVMLYELASGSAPYPHTDIDELRAAVLAGGVRPVDELATETSPILARLVMRCLSLDAAARPASAAEIAHELEAVLVDAPSIPEGNPYRGLRPFDAAHRRLFFGRGSDVGMLVDRLRTESLLVVAGDSGIGKSSVCLAGVLPAIVSGALGDRRRWRAVTMVPGRRPWSVVRDLLALPDGDDAAQLLRGAKPPADDGILLVVDQLEELITIAEPAEAERAARLFAAIADGVPGIKTVLSVRGDFLTRAAALPELGAALGRGLHLLRVLTATDLREAVIGPARATNTTFESPEIVDELVAAVAHNPGALPLLQFTLAELWRARDVERGIIERRTLDALGGVEGGLAAHANAVIHELGAEQREAARRILLRLTTSEHTRAIRERDELVGRDDPAAAAALESLVRGRLVIARDTALGEPEYEIAHEALIRSWGTLRDWLDAAAGEHAARNRLIASAAEWQRLERRAELLWGRRQLDEVAEARDLTSQEHAFVTASRAKLRRRRIFQIAAALAIPLLAIAIWLGVKIQTARERDRAIAARVALATTDRERADGLAGKAIATRARAFVQFDRNEPDAELTWTEARALTAEAHIAYREAAAQLEAAHLVAADAVRAEMVRVLESHVALAETERDHTLAADLRRRIASYDPTASRKPADAKLVVDVAGAASIAVHPFGPNPSVIAGRFGAVPVVQRDGHRVEVELAPGSYVVVVTMADGLVVRDAILLASGERLTRQLELPPAARVPAGFVYIPAGRMLFGTDRGEMLRKQFLGAQPIHEVETDAFLIARTEVTFGDWLEYLRALPAAERAARTPSGTVNLEERDGRFTLTLQPTDEPYHAAEGEPIVYPERRLRAAVRWERLPVSGIVWADVRAYVEWLRRGRISGARLCTEREWERAARGADGRVWPTGDELDPKDAGLDQTYGREKLAYGPDEVGTFAASNSPFDVADTAGNVWDWVLGPPDPTWGKTESMADWLVKLGGTAWGKGGSWYYGPLTAMASNRNTTRLRDVKIGFRVCADAPSAR